MSTKRTGLDVLQQFHAALRATQANPALLEQAAMAMTPEELRKAHEGLLVLTNSMATLAPSVPMAAAAVQAPAPVTSLTDRPASPARPVVARRPEPATESA